MTWLLFSLIVYSSILISHLLLKFAPSGHIGPPLNRNFIWPLMIRIILCLCVIVLALVASADFLVRYSPTLPDLTETFWINADLLRTVGVLWLQFCAALVSCFLLLSNGRDVTVVVHVK